MMCFCVARNGKITALLICDVLIVLLPLIMHPRWLIHSHSPEGPPSVCGVGGDSEVPVKFSCDSFRLYNMEAPVGGSCELLFNPQHIM